MVLSARKRRSGSLYPRLFQGVDLLTSFRAFVASCVIVVSASVAAAGVAWPQTVTPPALGVH